LKSAEKDPKNETKLNLRLFQMLSSEKISKTTTFKHFKRKPNHKMKPTLFDQH